MIVCFECGRLGNQLFQYVGIKKYFPGHKIIFIGYEDLAEVIEPIDAIIIKKFQLPSSFCFFVLQKMLGLLCVMRVVGAIEEQQNHSDFTVAVHRGLIPGVFHLKTLFFQHRQVVKEIPFQIGIKSSLVNRANLWITKQGAELKNSSLVFVHIRRGDYLAWPSKDSPAVLGLVWYQNTMRIMKERVNNPFFIIISDDLYYAKDFFSQCSNVVVSDNSLGVDLALMSLCCHGILSASTFAWWGAWLSRKNQGHNKSSLYLAPKYWAGHRRKEWFPNGFTSEWVTYID